jgi:C-terminal processing protease CtpA/Prc
MRTIAPEWPLCAARHVRRARAARLVLLPVLVATFAACEAPRGTIGAVIAQDDPSGRLFVRDAPPGLAAAKAGVQNGDEILLIDGLDVRAMNTHQIHVALSGDVDATVKLTLVRKDQILRVTLKRTEARKLVKSPGASE